MKKLFALILSAAMLLGICPWPEPKALPTLPAAGGC